MKLGMIGETIVNLIFSYDRIPLPYDNTAVVRIDTLLREGMITRNLSDMVKLFVPTPSIDEQKAIVGILDGVFDKEIEAKETAEQVIDQIDSMKKSILARAFRGELGTNDPADESAEELLKRIL